MKLEDIGFATLTDARAKFASRPILDLDRLIRCELILTSRCNFKCTYCRGLSVGDIGDIPFSDAIAIVGAWASRNLFHLRLSGGEPTLWPHLTQLVAFAKLQGITTVAVSTNGSADPALYKDLVEAGVDDFSISLDACCAATGDIMAGVSGYWEKVVDNIRMLSTMTYVTAGVTLNENNKKETEHIINFAHSLGVADIRIIPAAQYDNTIPVDLNIDYDILLRHPILSYRINAMKKGETLRGLSVSDVPVCPLVIDDMVIMAGYHYPCIVYMREGGAPISCVAGKHIEQVIWERFVFAGNHNTHRDPICSKQCLDFCRHYNNKVIEFVDTEDEDDE